MADGFGEKNGTKIESRSFDCHRLTVILQSVSRTDALGTRRKVFIRTLLSLRHDNVNARTRARPFMRFIRTYTRVYYYRYYCRPASCNRFTREAATAASCFILAYCVVYSVNVRTHIRALCIPTYTRIQSSMMVAMAAAARSRITIMT